MQKYNIPLTYKLKLLGSQAEIIFEEKLVSSTNLDKNYHIILHLIKLGVTNQNQIAKITNTNKSTILRRINELITLNYIHRRENSSSKREYTLSLSDLGLNVLRQYEAVQEEVTKSFFENISKEELIILENLLNKI